MAEISRREELEHRLAANPSSIAFAALAEEYRRAGQYEDAIRCCRIGLARHPAYLSARVTLGRALIEAGELDEAQRELNIVVAAAPDHLAAIRGLAEIHQRRGDLQAALNYYKRALDLAQHGDAASELADDIDVLPPPGPAPAFAPVPPASAAPPVDFDSLLASLGRPDAAPPPSIEKILTAPPTPAPVVAAATEESDSADPFVDLERSLRAYEPPRLDPIESDVLDELEGWLHAIIADRERRHLRPSP